MKNVSFFGIISTILLITLGYLTYSQAAQKAGQKEYELAKMDPTNRLNALATVPEELIVKYGEDIYYFPFAGANFGNALRQFKTQHENLEVTGIGADIAKMKENRIDRSENVYSSSYTATVGYFVTFREKGERE